MNTKEIREAAEALITAQKYSDECRKTLDKTLYRPADLEECKLWEKLHFDLLSDPATVISLCDAADGKREPKITSAMKAKFIGEFSWQEDAPYYDEDGNVVEHTATRVVPWDLCKRIYKEMSAFTNQPEADDE